MNDLAIETFSFDDALVVVTENSDGEIYAIKADYVQDLIDDWNGECNAVPPNEARVFFATYNGKQINPYECPDFGTMMEYLKRMVR